MLNDILLIKKIKKGDVGTYECVFRMYYSPLFLYSFSITRRKDIAEEIIQELFYKLWRDRNNLQITRSLKAYLYGAVRNQSLQYCESHQVREQHKQQISLLSEKEQNPTPHEDMEYRELEAVIERTLEKLPHRRREIFEMHRFNGLKYKEIAERLAISVKTVEAEMTKAYQALRKEIERYE